MSAVTKPSDSPTGLISCSRQRLRAAGRHLLERPGVYIMADEHGEVIYIGKAKNLRRRVSTYTNPSSMKDRKVSGLIARFHSLSCVETVSELEALLVESRLIKAKLPAFNRRLSEPESICYLRMDTGDRLPRIDVVAFRKDDGAVYLGPLWSTSLIREAAEAVTRVFRLHRCASPVSRDRPCAYYELNRCSAPCGDMVSDEKYRDTVQAAWDSLAGRSVEALELLTARRNRLAEELRFEEAYLVHRQIRALEEVATYSSEAAIPQGSFAVVVPSYLRGRPSVLFFAGGRLGDRLLAGPRTYPEESMLAGRLRRLAASERDLLPGRPSADDLLIIRSYLRQRGLSRYILPIRPDAHVAESSHALVSLIDLLRLR